ncbi:MAG: hypothetical protein ABSE69_04525 [Roseiarcus sp.]|jgi:hypothetical protein
MIKSRPKMFYRPANLCFLLALSIGVPQSFIAASPAFAWGAAGGGGGGGETKKTDKKPVKVTDEDRKKMKRLRWLCKVVRAEARFGENKNPSGAAGEATDILNDLDKRLGDDLEWQIERHDDMDILGQAREFVAHPPSRF